MSACARGLGAALLAWVLVACSSGTTTPPFPDGGDELGPQPGSDRGGDPGDPDRGASDGRPRPDGPPCGNGLLDPGEICDPKIAAGAPGACPASCDDDNACTADQAAGSAATCSASCAHQPYPDCCGNGLREGDEECDDGNLRPGDLCGPQCRLPGGHLLISEVATSPTAAEFVELFNPTNVALPLDNVYLADRDDYPLLVTGTIKGVASDFIARFPPGAAIKPGAFVTVAVSGADYATTYGRPADYAMRGATAPTLAMVAPLTNAIGATAGLTDGGELLVAFSWDGSADLVEDIDYLYWGAATSTTLPMHKTAELCVDGPDADSAPGCYLADTDPVLQSKQVPPASEGSLHRCDFVEGQERKSGGNGLLRHDETSEDLSATFARNAKTPGDRTPGKGPPPLLCWP